VKGRLQLSIFERADETQSSCATDAECVPIIFRKHTECLCLLGCECALPSVGVVAPDECDSAVSCIYSNLKALTSAIRFKRCQYK
jgi:hypothetical protein